MQDKNENISLRNLFSSHCYGFVSPYLAGGEAFFLFLRFPFLFKQLKLLFLKECFSPPSSVRGLDILNTLFCWLSIHCPPRESGKSGPRFRGGPILAHVPWRWGGDHCGLLLKGVVDPRQLDGWQSFQFRFDNSLNTVYSAASPQNQGS